MNAERQKSSGYDVEELGLGFVRLAGGITLSIEESWAMHYDGAESSRVHGSKGGVKLNPLMFFSQTSDFETAATIDSSAAFRLNNASVNPDVYESSQHHWIAALQGRIPLLDTAGIALNVALISEGIYQSQEKKRELKAGEILDASKSTALKL